MTLEDFIQQFEEQFDEVEPGTFTADKSIMELVEWSSMNILLIVSFIKIEFGIELNLKELRSCASIRELHRKITDCTEIAGD